MGHGPWAMAITTTPMRLRTELGFLAVCILALSRSGWLFLVSIALWPAGHGGVHCSGEKQGFAWLCRLGWRIA